MKNQKRYSFNFNFTFNNSIFMYNTIYKNF